MSNNQQDKSKKGCLFWGIVGFIYFNIVCGITNLLNECSELLAGIFFIASIAYPIYRFFRKKRQQETAQKSDDSPLINALNSFAGKDFPKETEQKSDETPQQPNKSGWGKKVILCLLALFILCFFPRVLITLIVLAVIIGIIFVCIALFSKDASSPKDDSSNESKIILRPLNVTPKEDQTSPSVALPATYTFTVEKLVHVSFQDYLKSSSFSYDLQNVKDQSKEPKLVRPLTNIKENNSSQSTTQRKTMEDSNTEQEIEIDLDLDFDLSPKKNNSSNSKKTSESLPSPDQFLKSKNLSYWIPTRTSLYHALSLSLQKRPEILPNDDIPILLFNDGKSKTPSVLEFDNSGDARVRYCTDSSVETELYTQNLKSKKRILLVPTESLPKGKQILLNYAVEELGTILKAEDISWTMKYITPYQGNVVVFEEANTVSTLRHSLALESIASHGRLYIVLCESDDNNIGISSDFHSQRDGLQKSFAQQAKTLCPFAWRRILLEKDENILSKSIYDLFVELDQQENAEALYLLRAYDFQPVKHELLPDFSCSILSDIILDIQGAWITIISEIIGQYRKWPANNNIQFEIEALNTKTIQKLCYQITDKLYNKSKEQDNCFPNEEYKSQLLKFSLALYSFVVAHKIVNNVASFLCSLLNDLNNTSVISRKYTIYKTKVSYSDFCKNELACHVKGINEIKSLINTLEITDINLNEEKNIHNDAPNYLKLVSMLQGGIYLELFRNDDNLRSHFKDIQDIYNKDIQDIYKNNSIECLPSSILSLTKVRLIERNLNEFIDKLIEKKKNHDRQYAIVHDSIDNLSSVYPALSIAMKPYINANPDILLKIINYFSLCSQGAKANNAERVS